MVYLIYFYNFSKLLICRYGLNFNSITSHVPELKGNHSALKLLMYTALVFITNHHKETFKDLSYRRFIDSDFWSIVYGYTATALDATGTRSLRISDCKVSLSMQKTTKLMRNVTHIYRWEYTG